jgi:hypothetical protein
VIGVEVLLVVPMVRKGIDVMGRELIGGVRERLRWMVRKVEGCLLRSWCEQVEGMWRILLRQLSIENRVFVQKNEGLDILTGRRD